MDLVSLAARARRILAAASSPPAPAAPSPDALAARCRALLVQLRGAPLEDGAAQPRIEELPMQVPAPATKDGGALPDVSHLASEGQGALRLVDFGGIPVVIDRPRGFVQRKLDESGAVLWERTYQNDYGYLAGTEGGDGEGLDVFLGPEVLRPDLPVWWAVQVNDAGGFDEYKLILGFESEAAARACYVAHIPEKYLASLTPMPVERVRALLGLPLLTLDASTKSAPAARAKLERCAKAIASATSFTGNTLPAVDAPADVRAIVEHAPLTWTYPNPDAVGGWLGAIEPDDEAWIAFVGVDGKVLLWTQREPTGGAIGLPFLLWRPDLARLTRVELVASTKAATVEEQFIFGIVLMPERTDLQREIYGFEVVRRTAHDYLAFFRNTDIQHKAYINDSVDLLECTVEKVAFWMARDGEAFPADPVTGAPIGVPPESPYRAANQLRFVPKGSWTVAHRIKDPELWAAIKRGEYTGYSINGLKKLAPQVAASA